jgi:adenosylcobinamide-GDP ribazoletransferase
MVALAEQRYDVFIMSLVASGAIGRWAMLWLMHTMRPIEGRQTLARTVTGQKTGRAIFVAAILGLPTVIAWLTIDPVGIAIAVAVSGIVLAAYRIMLLRRVGGSTGDLLGCSGYLVQLVVLLVAVSRFSH